MLRNLLLFTVMIVTAAAVSPTAQNTDSDDIFFDDFPAVVPEKESPPAESPKSDDAFFEEVFPTDTAKRTTDDGRSTSGKGLFEKEGAEEKTIPREPEKLHYSATIDMQVDKEMYDEFVDGGSNRFRLPNLQGTYRKIVDDFWMRVALRGSLELTHFETALALRFYPYWMMRRMDRDNDRGDMEPYLDLTELNQAYLKVFADYSMDDSLNRFHIYLKIGRDGLLNSCSQLFGNYLDLPTAGYGDSRYINVVGPFKNRKVFANQLELGFTFKIGDLVSGRTSAMIGGNVNNEKWYTAPNPALFQLMDSRLSAGFSRVYQDIFLWNDRIHLGGGFRIYTTKVDKTEPVITVTMVEGVELRDTSVTTFVADSRYVNGDWTFDIVPFTHVSDFKFYSEFAYQRLGVGSSTGIVRPFNMGITIPTGNVVDILAIEFENAAKTFFSTESMRDKIGNRKSHSGAWGIVVEKNFMDHVIVAWGLYTANPSGDLKTTLRLSSGF
ncbi:MAG: hypothetical protein JXA18_04495 [Chitinispirillaceae bacterium]|nr:hypothetical protein [Chitinispirillaceae bacterium]